MIKLRLPQTNHHTALIITISFTLLTTLNLVCPSSAHADFFTDSITGGLTQFLVDLTNNFSNACLETLYNIIKGITVASPLTNEWSNAFGGTTGGQILEWAETIRKTAVLPVASTVLSFVILVHLLKLSSKMDANGTLPAVKEIIILFATISIYIWLINHIGDILGGVYGIFTAMTNKLLSYNSNDMWSNITFITPDTTTDLSDALMILVFCLLGLAAAIIAYIFALVMSYARILQLYIMATFAPLPIAFLGVDETRQWGVGFFKNFISVCLAGTILAFVLLSFPFVISAVYNTATSGEGLLGGVGWNVLNVIACCIVLILGVIKSGSWARDILGG